MKVCDLKKGDKVIVECMNGLGSGGEDVVVKVSKMYVYVGDDDDVQKFSRKTGIASEPPTKYYIHPHPSLRE